MINASETTCHDAPELWVTDEQAAALWDITSSRTARYRLRNCEKRFQPTGGRPRALYYIGAIPELLARAVPGAEPALRITRKQRRSLAPDDLATACLRAEAVRQYLTVKQAMSEEHAAAVIMAEWSGHPRRREVTVNERLPGGHVRKIKKDICVGGFSISTLRSWTRKYEEAGPDVNDRLAALAPDRKGNVGARRSDIPEGLLNLVHALAVSGPRADLEKALREARIKWPGEFPAVSYDTWLRRMRERDASRFCDSLGKKGIADFLKQHSPDIERDYSKMRFNEEWQLDDITEDFYGHGVDPRDIIRPNVYAIIRVSTRQWICAVACEAKITQDQVRAMIGYALASKSGGIPEKIKFERGTIACEKHLADQLTALGIDIGKTSMIGGRVEPGALPDAAKGWPQGKAVIEANIRLGHGYHWQEASQVGTDERHSLPPRVETLKALAAKLAEKGEFLILPTVGEWQQKIFQALEKHNNAPHGGLREIIDAASGKPRHMTPNEAAQLLKADALTVMDEQLLPLFFQKGVLVDVTKNGFRLNDETYGRFDDQLQDLAGTQVTAYGLKELPDAAYVVELGRCVERFVKPLYGDETAAFGHKTRIGKAKRSQYEQLMSDARGSAGATIIDALKFTGNPTPDRAFNVLCPDALKARAVEISAGQTRHQDKQTRRAKRFDLSDDAPASAPHAQRGRGLLAKARELRGQVEVLQTPAGDGEDRFHL